MPESLPAAFRYGRLACGLILSLMLAAVLYGAWYTIANWSAIAV